MMSNFLRLDPTGLFNIINQAVSKKVFVVENYIPFLFTYKAQHFFNKSLLDSPKSVVILQHWCYYFQIFVQFLGENATILFLHYYL